MKKNKFIDKCKSWLLTLGVASVFGLAALGVNAAKSYEKASAYEYQDNGELYFNLPIEDSNNIYNFNLLYDYARSGSYDNSLHIYYREIELDIGYSSNTNYIVGQYQSSPVESKAIFFITGSLTDYSDDRNYIRLLYDYDNGYWYAEDNYLSDYEWSDFAYSLPSYEGYQSLLNYTLSYNAPQQSGNFITALTSFMSLLGGAIVQLATPVASGVTQFASALFIDNSHLSIMGGIIGIFAGIALAIGITSKVYAWVSTLGN